MWGLGIGPNPQSPIPNPQSPIPIDIKYTIPTFRVINSFPYKSLRIYNILTSNNLH